MKILLISRQFSQTFSCIKKSNNFQNEIKSIFLKSKQKMNESSKQMKSASNAKSSDGEIQKSETTGTVPNHSYHRKSNDNNRYDGHNSQNTINYSNDSNVNSYHFYNSFPNNAVNYEPTLGYSSHPSHYEPIYYQMNGGMYYPPTYRPSYHRSYSSGPSFGYSNHSVPKRKYCQNSRSTNGEQLSERIMKFRQMIIKSKSSDDILPNEFQFSVMTYNILSQNLLENHSSLYGHCEPSALSWPQRGNTILKELLDSDCDIICLQEVHSQHFDQLLSPALKERGYNWIFKQRTGGKMDGCALLYKDNKFSLLNEIKLDFMRKDLSTLLDRDNIAIIVKLKPKEWNRDTSLIVANTHLLYNPRRGDVKLAQIRLLMAEIDKIAKISEKDGLLDYNPIILCGDLNSEPNSLIYNFITKGVANFDGHKIGDISGQSEGFGKGRDMEDHHLKLLGVTSDTRFEESSQSQKRLKEKMSIKHNFQLKSVVSKFENKFGQKLISSSNRFGSGLVDYIFYDYKKLKLCSFQRLPIENQLPQIGYIPNSLLGSDHLSIKAIFSIV